jgi:hypothetical protein
MNPITTTLYQVGGTIPGALSFKLTLNASQTSDNVNGKGQLNQETAPPLKVNTFLSGQEVTIWTPIVPSPISKIITLTGYSEPLIVPLGRVNVKCTITMLIDPTVGVAQLQYRTTDSGPWKVLENLPVRATPLVPA